MREDFISGENRALVFKFIFPTFHLTKATIKMLESSPKDALVKLVNLSVLIILLVLLILLVVLILLISAGNL